MKNVFDCNLDTDKMDGEVFCTQQVSSYIETESDTLLAQLENVEKHTSTPWHVTIIQCLCIIVLFCEFSTFLDSTMNLLDIILTTLSIIILIAIFIIEKRKEKDANSIMTSENIESKSLEIFEDIKKEFSVPDDNWDIDILLNMYKIKNGKKKRDNTFHYFNFSSTIYKKGENLCILVSGLEFSIPFNNITKIEKISKNLSLPNWHKPESPNDPKYKKYKAMINGVGITWIKAYYVLNIDSPFGQYEILTPNYEEDILKKFFSLE